jgi:hypothetical protein
MDATSLQQTLFWDGYRASGFGYRREEGSRGRSFPFRLSTLDSSTDFVASQALALTAEGLECSDADAEAVLMERGRPP